HVPIVSPARFEPSAGTAPHPPDDAAPAAASYPGRRALAPADANATANVGLDSGATFAAGALLGGLLTLAGVALGARLGRGSHAAHGERGTRRQRSR
ncbi:MAG: hypothetical protein ACRCY9_14995, partial [Phycicoccus sp.]